MAFSDKCVTSTTTQCGADISEETVVSIIIIFHPENGSRGLLHNVGTYVPKSIIVQQYATMYSFIIFLQTAPHVSGDTLTHHQEHM